MSARAAGTRKVLIVANLFHASPRIPGIARYLAEFGWEPVILTKHLGTDFSSRFGPFGDLRTYARTIETIAESPALSGAAPPSKIDVLRRLNMKAVPGLKSVYRFFSHYFYRAIWHYPDEEKRWRTFALRTGGNLLAGERFDAILSSSSPVTCHLVADELKKKFGLPWVADLRDLWSQNHNYYYGIIRKAVDRRLERKTLAGAGALVTVTPVWRDRLADLHRRKAVYTVTNGFEPKFYTGQAPPLPEKFTITYTGQVLYYSDPGNLRMFLSALKELIEEGTVAPGGMEVRFYTPFNDWLEAAIQKAGLGHTVKQWGSVSREAAAERQRESHLLAMFNWDTTKERGCYPTKIFEYLGARRPILVVGGSGDDVIVRLLRETNAGQCAVSASEAKNVLKQFYLEFRKHGKIRYGGDEEAIGLYSYREKARAYARILDQVTGKTVERA